MFVFGFCENNPVDTMFSNKTYCLGKKYEVVYFNGFIVLISLS